MKWTKASEKPPEMNTRETFVCIVQKKEHGATSIRPVYAEWFFSKWQTEEGWTVIEWLDESAEHIEPMGVEEAAKEWDIDYESSSDLNTDLETAFKAGASWQATQPVSDAVEFIKWVEDQHPFTSLEDGVRYYHIKDAIYTVEQLYQLFKSPVRGKTYR